MTRKKYCGTAAKAGGNGENKPRPKVMGVPCLLENGQCVGLLFAVLTVVTTGAIAEADIQSVLPENLTPEAESSSSDRMTRLVELFYKLLEQELGNI